MFEAEGGHPSLKVRVPGWMFAIFGVERGTHDKWVGANPNGAQLSSGEKRAAEERKERSAGLSDYFTRFFHSLLIALFSINTILSFRRDPFSGHRPA